MIWTIKLLLRCGSHTNQCEGVFYRLLGILMFLIRKQMTANVYKFKQEFMNRGVCNFNAAAEHPIYPCNESSLLALCATQSVRSIQVDRIGAQNVLQPDRRFQTGLFLNCWQYMYVRIQYNCMYCIMHSTLVQYTTCIHTQLYICVVGPDSLQKINYLRKSCLTPYISRFIGKQQYHRETLLICIDLRFGLWTANSNIKLTV